MIEQAEEYLTQYIDHRHMRTNQILEHLTAIPGATAQELAQVIYADIVPGAFIPIAARQITAHLEWLEKRDRVVKSDSGYIVVSP